MKRSRIISVVLPAFICVSLIAACAAPPQPATPPPAPATTPAAPGEPQPDPGDELEYTGPLVILNVALGAASTGHSGIALLNFADRVNARGGGHIEVRAFPDSQLGSEREASEGVALGTIEMSTIGMGTFATFYERLQFVNTPFLLADRPQSHRFYDGEFMQALNEDVRQAIGVRILAYGENGTRGISNNTREIRTPADLAGLRIRMQENPLHIAMINEMGGSATPIAFAELFTALQQGTVDGQDNGIPLTVNNRLFEVQPYFTTLAHTIDQLAFIANDAWFSSLDPIVQQILTEEVENWRDDMRRLVEEFDDSGIETMEASGVTVTHLTDAERQAFRDMMEPVFDIARGIVGEDFFNQALAATDAAR